MEKNIFIDSVIVCLAAHMIRSVYEIAKHKQIVKPNKVSFVIIFTTMGLLWATWFTLCSLDLPRMNLPDIIRYAGMSLVGIGVLIFLTALFTIKTLETYEGDLITKGIYSKIRHPMYLGFILWLIGLPMFYGGMYSFFLLVPFIANVLLWRHLEDAELVKRFPLYQQYKNVTIF
jgi:protein-S-isoprenylcysteine O-methyltransferase Ste14